MKLRDAAFRILWLCPLLACTDEDPTALPIDLEPSAYVSPNTGLDCGPRCLRDDVAQAWTITGNSPSDRNQQIIDIEDPTQKGASVNANYCWYRKSDDYFYGCIAPHGWSTGYARYPDRYVSIVGYELSGTGRVFFGSYAQEPQLEILEYERPENPTCHTTSMTVCYGEYRLKIAVRNAGWYGTDRVYINGFDANGQGWTWSDAGHSVEGETIEYVWDRAFPATPGARVVVTYYAWDTRAEGKIELSVPMVGSSPTLTLQASEVITPGGTGPAGVQVAAGTPVFFEPSAPGSSLIRIESWVWTPADTTQSPLTQTCGPTESTCTVPVFENGTMKVTARVDGQVREATAPVGVAPPELAVTAAPNRVQAGTNVHFQADAIGGDAINLSWRWNPDSASSTTVACLAGQASCDLAVQESGWMVASADVAGVACADSAYVKVFCDFFANEPADSILSDTSVQRIFSELWVSSNPGDPQVGVERGGYLVRRNGGIELEPFIGPSDLCRVLPTNGDFASHLYQTQQTGEIIGVVHTHPMVGQSWANNGRCFGATDPVLSMDSIPSPADMALVGYLRYYGLDVRAYVINPTNVIPYSATWDGTGDKEGRPNPPVDQAAEPPFARNTTCTII